MSNVNVGKYNSLILHRKHYWFIFRH